MIHTHMNTLIWLLIVQQIVATLWIEPIELLWGSQIIAAEKSVGQDETCLIRISASFYGKKLRGDLYLITLSKKLNRFGHQSNGFVLM